MKKILFALCLALLMPADVFAGKVTDLQFRTKNLLNKINTLTKQEVVIYKHIPTLATFAKAKINVTDEDSTQLEISVVREKIALTNPNVPLPEGKDAFWYAYLTNDERLRPLLNPPLTSVEPEISDSIIAHGRMVPASNDTFKKETERELLKMELRVLDKALSTLKEKVQKQK